MDKGKTLLERLYRGEVFPAEEIVPSSDEYRAAMKERNAFQDRVLEGMSEKQARLLEDYEGVIENVHRLDLQTTYAEGVRFGVRLLLESLGGGFELPPQSKK
ncbi:DUF6809 family protein [Acutalibacter muris]|uniref:DUF6809 family protein n=1 Tax=Acutalibacter muris TaxID=1796620 RepID=UPI001C3EA790|nr:DUF6809 family protein [Acutalibacter muris]